MSVAIQLIHIHNLNMKYMTAYKYLKNHLTSLIHEYYQVSSEVTLSTTC